MMMVFLGVNVLKKMMMMAMAMVAMAIMMSMVMIEGMSVGRL